ncbi:hypothetical protein WJX73_002648 [Symbiochloris irregularis]|uniref:Uncharacterized protein n=1 Tax=Symbiochloris irregularis TaxID=706552 RepID=A0AAW1PFC7_9CHLO
MWSQTPQHSVQGSWTARTDSPCTAGPCSVSRRPAREALQTRSAASHGFTAALLVQPAQSALKARCQHRVLKTSMQRPYAERSVMLFAA